jgi:hypothetical protein
LKYQSLSKGYCSSGAETAGGESLISTFPGESTFPGVSQTTTAGSQGGSAAATGAAASASAAAMAAKSNAAPEFLIGMTFLPRAVIRRPDQSESTTAKLVPLTLEIPRAQLAAAKARIATRSRMHTFRQLTDHNSPTDHYRHISNC